MSIEDKCNLFSKVPHSTEMGTTLSSFSIINNSTKTACDKGDSSIGMGLGKIDSEK